MRGWIRKLEAIAAAAAFAEQGEWQMARSILHESEKRTAQRQTDRVRQPRTRVRDRSYRV
ncbi:MAG: hypothetical protein HY912_02445 [Desulfomonile tiedjei]|uniref:Uncharacterized protein n=1 Tax=Desulfomonile tiedjei TaxID=2358 RepID=A0A9D6UXP2_9BACT|nr:hypothetical protein [Desulfomonile tiedjei]